jgi:hypothetical protein
MNDALFIAIRIFPQREIATPIDLSVGRAYTRRFGIAGSTTTRQGAEISRQGFFGQQRRHRPADHIPNLGDSGEGGVFYYNYNCPRLSRRYV